MKPSKDNLITHIQKQSYFLTFKNLFVCGLAALLTVTGCKKTALDKRETQPTHPRSAGDGKNDLLGYGYDVTGEYANSSASTYSVFNADALKKDYPTRVEWDLSSKQEGILTSGEDAESYLKKRALTVSSTVGVSAFKATITASFSSSDAFSSKYVYSSFNLIIQQKRAKINADITLLKQYLQPTFIADIKNNSAQAIVDKYGTHVLTDIILGAKLEVMYRSETTKEDRTQAASAGVDVGVGKVFSINTGYNYSDNTTKSNYGQSLHYKTYGGEPSKSLIGDISIGTDVPKVNVKDWQASSSLDNAELIDFGPNGLVPLYEFIDDPLKKEAVKTYIAQYLKANQVVLINEVYARFTYENAHTSSNGSRLADVYIRLYDRDKKTLKATPNDLTVNVVSEMTSGPYKHNEDPSWFETHGLYFFNIKVPAGQNSVLYAKDFGVYSSGKGTWGAIPLWGYFVALRGNGYQPLNDTNPWQ